MLSHNRKGVLNASSVQPGRLPNIIIASTDKQKVDQILKATTSNFPAYNLADNTVDLDLYIKNKLSITELAKQNTKILITEFPLAFLGNSTELNTLTETATIITTVQDLNSIQRSIECFISEADEPKKLVNSRFEKYWETIRSSMILIDDLENQRQFYRYIRSFADKTQLESPHRARPLQSNSINIFSSINRFTFLIPSRNKASTRETQKAHRP